MNGWHGRSNRNSAQDATDGLYSGGESMTEEFDKLMSPVQKVKERERINTLKFFISRLEGMGK